MSFIGDYAAGDTLDFKFTTRRFSTGAPHQLAGTPSLAVYKSNSTTQSTSGITLTVDFDSVTGQNHVRIDTTADGTFYANGSQFDVVIAAGTVDSVSVVGEVVGRFTLGILLRPTTAGRTLTIESDGMAHADLKEWLGTAPLALASQYVQVDTIKVGGTTQTARDIGASVLLSSGTGTGQLEFTSGVVKANAVQLDGGAQSLLDLKDFADEGYNPSVNGILLCSSVSTVSGNVNGNVGGNVTGSIGSLATQANADVQLEAEEALQTYHLDHLIASADPGGAVANSSFWAKLHSKSATPAYSSYDNTTDSLEANRDNIGTAGAGLTIAGIAGTITTLDALDTAQDTQHSNTLTRLGTPTGASLSADLATLLAADRAYAKNVAVTGFVFPMLDTSGDPATGKTITAEISKDGGAFAAIAASVSEISGGWYKVDIAQAEINADEIALKFTASGCRQLNMKIRTQA